MTKATQQQTERQNSRYVDKFEIAVVERKGELYGLIHEKAQDLCEIDDIKNTSTMLTAFLDSNKIVYFSLRSCPKPTLPLSMNSKEIRNCQTSPRMQSKCYLQDTY
jgi:hypothetical protein